MDLDEHRWGVVAPDWAANALVVQEYPSHAEAQAAAKEASRLNLAASSPVASGEREWQGVLPLVYDDGGWTFHETGCELARVTDWAVA